MVQCALILHDRAEKQVWSPVISDWAGKKYFFSYLDAVHAQENQLL